MALGSRLTWIRPDEQILFRVRRHWVALLARILVPLTVLALSVLVILVVEYMFDVVGSIRVVPLLVISLFAFLWLVWELLDWENDLLTLTTERLMFTDRVIMIREMRQEIPLNRIQNVKVRIPSLTAIMLGIGELEIESAGRLAPIRFAPVGNPRYLQSVIFDAVANAGMASSGGLGSPGPRSVPAATIVGMTQPAREVLRERLMSLVVVPRSTLGADPIIYRKHQLFLFLEELPPLFALFLWVLGLAFRPEAEALFRAANLPPVIGAVGYLLIGMLIIGWLIYTFIDWWNDIYVLNATEVIDVQKVPLRSEDRRQASLGVIQDVRYVQLNPIAKLFNYGNLVLETAGTAGAFTFDRVPNPQLVQQTISERVFDFRERQAHEEQDRRERELQTIMDRWWEKKQQTPPP